MEKASQAEPKLSIGRLFEFLSDLCDTAAKPVVLLIDEVDSASNNQVASREKNQFLRGGRLDMELVLKKFVEHYDLIYGDNAEKIDEDEGRRRFLLYLRPIINGSGNYYVEAMV